MMLAEKNGVTGGGRDVGDTEDDQGGSRDAACADQPRRMAMKVVLSFEGDDTVWEWKR